MRFVAALNTWIFGVYYAQGAEVNTEGWTRKMLLQFLELGIIQASYLTVGAITDSIEFEGDGVTVEEVGDKIVVTLDTPAPAYSDLTDVNMSGLADGNIPVWDEDTSRWRPQALVSGGGSAAPRYWVLQTASLSSGVMPVTDTLIPGTQLVIPASDDVRMAFVDVLMTWTGTHTCRLSLYLDGSLATFIGTPAAATSETSYSVSLSGYPVALASGAARTLDLRWSPSASTAAVTMTRRHLAAEVRVGSTSPL